MGHAVGKHQPTIRVAYVLDRSERRGSTRAVEESQQSSSGVDTKISGNVLIIDMILIMMMMVIMMMMMMMMMMMIIIVVMVMMMMMMIYLSLYLSIYLHIIPIYVCQTTVPTRPLPSPGCTHHEPSTPHPVGD